MICTTAELDLLVDRARAALDDAERHYSIELGLEVVREFKLELHCADEHADELVAAIVATARTGQRCAGWVYVTDLDGAYPIR